MNDLRVQTYFRNESPSGFIPQMKYVGLQNCFFRFATFADPQTSEGAFPKEGLHLKSPHCF